MDFSESYIRLFGVGIETPTGGTVRLNRRRALVLQALSARNCYYWQIVGVTKLGRHSVESALGKLESGGLAAVTWRLDTEAGQQPGPSYYEITHIGREVLRRGMEEYPGLWAPDKSTLRNIKVLKAVADGHEYVQQIIPMTGLKIHVVYTRLYKLEGAGFVDVGEEPREIVERERRRPRARYTLSTRGREELQRLMTQYPTAKP